MMHPSCTEGEAFPSTGVRLNIPALSRRRWQRMGAPGKASLDGQRKPEKLESKSLFLSSTVTTTSVHKHVVQIPFSISCHVKYESIYIQERCVLSVAFWKGWYEYCLFSHTHPPHHHPHSYLTRITGLFPFSRNIKRIQTDITGLIIFRLEYAPFCRAYSKQTHGDRLCHRGHNGMFQTPTWGQ